MQFRFINKNLNKNNNNNNQNQKDWEDGQEEKQQLRYSIGSNEVEQHAPFLDDLDKGTGER